MDHPPEEKKVVKECDSDFGMTQALDEMYTEPNNPETCSANNCERPAPDLTYVCDSVIRA